MTGTALATHAAPKVLKIGLVMQGGRSWMGGASYIQSLADAIAGLEPAERRRCDLRLFYKDAHPARALGSLEAFDAVHEWPVWKRAARKCLRRLGRGNSPAFDALAERGVDFAYPHWDEGPAPYRSAAWIPDFQHRHLPEFFDAREIAYRDALFARIARIARTVVLSSRAAADDFVRFYPAHAHKARILSASVTPRPEWTDGDAGSVAGRYALPERFFIVSNQFWKHKNHAVVWDALAALAAGGVRPAVVCTGLVADSRNAAYGDEVRRRLRQSGIDSQVFLLGLIPRGDQIRLMRRAVAVIQPSLFEGWSGTVEDARALGKAVLLSDIPVHREQAPPHASFFDPRDSAALAALVENVWRTLPAGPDAAREAAAAGEARRRSREFASRFLAIAEAV